MRLDGHFRVDATNNTVRGRYDAGGGGDTGYVDVTLTSGIYAGLAALCAEVQTQLQIIDANFEVGESSGVVTINADGPTIEIVWLSLPLMNWLGFDANLGSSNSYTASVTSPGTFVASLPWFSDAPIGWEWSFKRFRSDHQTGGAIKLSRLDLWNIGATVTRSELARLRSVLDHMAKGYPARWWRDTDVATVQSSSNWWGYVDVTFAPGFGGYSERWLDDYVTAFASIDLEFAEAS